MFPSGGQFDSKPPVLSSQASLVLIYRPTKGMKDGVNIAQPESSGVKSQDLGGQFTGPKREIGGHQTCLSINRLWHELCDMVRRLVGTTAPGHHDCSIQE
ncbi:hypothetical protein TNCV_3258011 [Trichonephila clavipes]|nr:hypothetical protein TNCV_3258011 [Trichonephila clavipes]